MFQKEDGDTVKAHAFVPTLMLTALQSTASTEATTKTYTYKNQHLRRNTLLGKENNFPEKARSDKEMQPENTFGIKTDH